MVDRRRRDVVTAREMGNVWLLSRLSALLSRLLSRQHTYIYVRAHNSMAVVLLATVLAWSCIDH